MTDADGVAKWEERTHYEADEYVEVIPDLSVTIESEGKAATCNELMGEINPGVYRVTLDGVTYECEAYLCSGFPAIGNASYWGGKTGGNGEPFFLLDYTDYEGYVYAPVGTHTLKLEVVSHVCHKIPSDFIPWEDSPSGVVGAAGTGLNSEIFNDYADNVASGAFSHAEGVGVTASGDYSHAEGAACKATAYAAHAEGDSTQATNGYTHSEGSNTVAAGYISHAEGLWTIARGKHQHVQGKYNIEDISGVYAHIVGNGTSNTQRSNAHTLDWNGNGWFAGTVEGTGVIVKSSTEGSTKRFMLTVDDSGTVTATEVT